MDQSRVTPLLVGVKNSDIEGPLSQFNTTSINKSDIFKLMRTINKQLADSSLPDQAIEKAFEKWWPELEASLTDAVNEVNKTREARPEPKRSQGEILDEILELTRGISRQVAKSSASDYLRDDLRRYIVYSRLKDFPKDINYFTRNELKDLTLDDIKCLKGNVFKSGEQLKEKLEELLLEKVKEEQAKKEEADN